MNTNRPLRSSNRRNFLGKIAGTAAFMSVGGLSSAMASPRITPTNHFPTDDPDEWVRMNTRGRRKLVVDGHDPSSIHTFTLPLAFQMSSFNTGTPKNEVSVLVVLRADAVIYALNDAIWAKYQFGEEKRIKDPRTAKITTRNPYWETKADDFKVPGIGLAPIGIKEHQSTGVSFCVCDIALTIHSAVQADATGQDEAAVKKEFYAGLIPGIERMPSGVWALSRAQEYGCTYVTA